MYDIPAYGADDDAKKNIKEKRVCERERECASERARNTPKNENIYKK